MRNTLFVSHNPDALGDPNSKKMGTKRPEISMPFGDVCGVCFSFFRVSPSPSPHSVRPPSDTRWTVDSTRFDTIRLDGGSEPHTTEIYDLRYCGADLECDMLGYAWFDSTRFDSKMDSAQLDSTRFESMDESVCSCISEAVACPLLKTLGALRTIRTLV